MARSRNIKPSLFKNELLGEADPLLTILFTGLWCLADRDGKLEDRPKRIKAEIFPYRELPLFNGYLTELEQLGFIDRYEVDGCAVIQVVSFAKHQSPHKTEKHSELPSKPLDSSVTVKAPLSNESITKEAALIPDSLNLIPDSGFLSADSGKRAHNGSKSCFVPDDWEPNPIIQRQAMPDPSVDIGKELSLFKLHEFSQPKSDWVRAWVAWLRRAKPTRDNSPTSKSDATTEALRRFVRGQD